MAGRTGRTRATQPQALLSSFDYPDRLCADFYRQGRYAGCANGSDQRIRYICSAF